MSLLTACSDDDIDRVYTVGEAENTLILRAGVSEDGAGVVTRAGDENHSKHVAFASGTQIALRVDGTWTGHSPEAIKQKTVATLGGASEKHNALSTYDPVLFWDDYGTADPANASTGRAQGLTIYGAAVDGKTSLPTTLSGLDKTQSTWKNLAWQVCTGDEPAEDTNIIDQTGGYVDYDLVTSNNVVYSSTPANDNAYKFADRSAGKLLEFTHAMTKITVQLTAGEGFPRTDEANAATAQFESAPTVTLVGFYYKGTVDVEAKTSTPITTATANVKMHGGTAAHIATFDALVFPGNTFSATIANDDKFTPTSSDNILELNADGNIYKVTAAQLVKAIVGTSKTGEEVQGTLEQGKNYILNITVKKTDLDITATILDWKTVEAEEESPKINVDKVYGHEGTAFKQNFDFFRSTSKASGYSKDAWVEHTESSGTHTYTFHDQLYWPNHQTHYFFRGVYPRVQTDSQADSQAGWIPTNKVSSSTSSASTIAVSNVAYEEGKYPSDLAFGWPKKDNDVDSDETCKVHTDKQGICATEGQIRMNFKYVMSKVQFSLTSTGTATLGNIVDLTNVKVEIIDGYSKGKIRLSDGLHEEYALEDKGVYPLTVAYTPADQYKATTLDAIVPQELSDDVLVRISILDSDDKVLDVYEAQLNQIKVKTNNNTGALITEWLPGNYYKYYLDINKTAINVTATLTDWVEVTAKDEVWF